MLQLHLLQGNQHYIGGASDKSTSQPIITTAFQVGNDSITRTSTTAFISLPAAIMSSQVAKAASNVVSIAKVRTTNTAWGPMPPNRLDNRPYLRIHSHIMTYTNR